MVLPFFVLTLSYLGEYSLIMRSSLLETLGEDFIITARAKGVRENRVLYGHAVPNALLPTMTVTILQLGFVLSGVITIELIFNWPGLGLLTATSVDQRDFPILQGLFLLFSASVIVANLVADLLYSYLDPRVQGGLSHATPADIHRARRPRPGRPHRGEGAAPHARSRSRGPAARPRRSACGRSTGRTRWGWPA